jgi:magnesium chelatase family protein
MLMVGPPGAGKSMLAARLPAILPPLAPEELLEASMIASIAGEMRLSAGGYHRVLRVARTLADLDGADKVSRVHLAEALSHRALIDDVRRAA